MAMVTHPVAHTPRTYGDGGVGFIVGVILLAFLAILFFVYGLPALRDAANTTNGDSINVTIPNNLDTNPVPIAPTGRQNQSPSNSY